MAFKRDYFSPVYVTTSKAPSIFSYSSDEDTLADVMKPGYFNSMRTIVRVNSMIDVVCKDCAARLVVGRPTGLNVVIRPDYFLAKFAEEMVEEPKLTPAQKRANTIAAKKAKILELAKTG